MTKYQIVVGVCEPVVLGCVLYPSKKAAAVGNLIKRLWRQFQATEPDCDSLFMDFLLSGQYSFFEAPSEEIFTIVV